MAGRVRKSNSGSWEEWQIDWQGVWRSMRGGEEWVLQMGKDQAQEDVVTSRFWVAVEAPKARRKAIIDLCHGTPGNVGYTDESGKFSCFSPLIDWKRMDWKRVIRRHCKRHFWRHHPCYANSKPSSVVRAVAYVADRRCMPMCFPQLATTSALNTDIAVEVYGQLKLPFKAIRCESSLPKRRPFVRRYTARGYTTYN